jgi:hypothetical protein
MLPQIKSAFTSKMEEKPEPFIYPNKWRENMNLSKIKL